MTINDLLDNLKNYSEEELEKIKKAYHYADTMHKGQLRQSGEEYITHPLHVAYILSDMHADCDTICAALLHDTLEDTKATKEEIAELFNKDVANLVDGVTKISKMNFSTKKEENLANTRKIITGITTDVRIIIIKLADRLHNMRTLSFKSRFKQQENAVETLDIFTPLAYLIGAYRIKSELEDLSLKYLYPEEYRKLEEIMQKESQENNNCLNEMLVNIDEILNNEQIPHEIKVRTKNIYGIYKRLHEGNKIRDIHDLLSLKIMVDEVRNCYITLGLIHSKYHPVNDKFKDYICNPKTNLYQSLHTTVFGLNERLIQTQIRTFNMDKIASFGLTAYWDIHSTTARDKMQNALKNKYQFFKSLIEINTVFGDNQQFVQQIKNELFSDKVYVYTTKGEIIELPKGATIIDFAYKLSADIGNTMVAAFVNDEPVRVNYTLKNKDRVRIIVDNLSYGARKEWLNNAYTSYAKEKIKEFIKNK